MEKERKIPFKNYIILGVVLIITAVLVIYFYMWYSTYEESKLNIPIMNKYMQVINYNELDNYLVENKDSIIYTSVLENQTIRNFEVKLKNVIVDYSLKNSILYLDLTKELKDIKKIKELKEIYKLNDEDITNTPSILVFKDGKLNDIYNIKENNYDINNLIEYLKNKNIIEEGSLYD